MARAKYEPASADVHTLIEKVINAYPHRFMHINRADLHLTFKDHPTSAWRGRTRLLNEFYSSLTSKKIAIEFHKQYWEECNEDQKAMLIMHELFHILFDEKNREYKLRQHDVKDFYELLKEFGLNYESANNVLKQTA